MTRTKRIYNNPRLRKTPRYNLDDGAFHIRNGIPYTWRSWICMGRCPQCRDPNKETSIIRKRSKEEVKRDLALELNEGECTK